jgi:uncharacterized membrane protein YeaQ/YmgE (transglycosylase-associated protein family)
LEVLSVLNVATSLLLIQPRNYYVELFTPGFIGTLIFGMLAGWLTGVLTRGRGYGCIVDILLGLIGAFIGNFIFAKLGIAVFGFVGNLAAAVVGAVVLVAAVRLIAGSRD